VFFSLELFSVISPFVNTHGSEESHEWQHATNELTPVRSPHNK
jgi:hypothetical protein